MAATEEQLAELASLGERLQATQLGAVLAGWSVGELIDAGEAVADLEEHPGFKVLTRLLREARESAMVSLIHAPRATENAAALQKQLGLVKGLDALTFAVPTICEKAEKAKQIRQTAAEAADAERQEQST